jgi:valine--pyruvate aminotransferase
MEFSNFGRKMTANAGILSLMDDLGKIKAESGPEMVMMGGGNPGQVPEFQELMRQQLLAIGGSRESFRQLIGSYGPPQGEDGFLGSLAALLREMYGWDIGTENICLTNGSQTAFFMLFNLLGGSSPDGSYKRICLPMAPEYIGYADLGLDEDLFVSFRPRIELLEQGLFKYHIDFDNLVLDERTAAICISRPTNPTGNVVSDKELLRLDELAQARGIPLIVDSAYGLPFPGMMYVEAQPVWHDNIILCLSLSKLGLPAVRTGIVIARPEIVRALTSMNAIMSLTPSSFGAILAQQLMASRQIVDVAGKMMQPFYRRKMQNALSAVQEYFHGLPVRVHRPEGAMFLWLWFADLPMTSLELYQRLKDAGVLVVSGHYFFPGLKEEWRHRTECLRVTYSQRDEDVTRGLAIIAAVVSKAYNM